MNSELRRAAIEAAALAIHDSHCTIPDCLARPGYSDEHAAELALDAAVRFLETVDATSGSARV